MAQLQVTDEASGLSAGMRIWSEHPSATAAVPEAFAQLLCQPGDIMSCWAVHKNEQTGLRDQAYEEERAELGQQALVHVEELVRPRQQNVVWIDRYHLLAQGAPVAAATRIAGLYVQGNGGRAACFLHDPSVTHTVGTHVMTLPQGGQWDESSVTLSCRASFLVGEQPNLIQVRFPPALMPAAHAAIQQLHSIVAAW